MCIHCMVLGVFSEAHWCAVCVILGVTVCVHPILVWCSLFQLLSMDQGLIVRIWESVCAVAVRRPGG